MHILTWLIRIPPTSAMLLPGCIGPPSTFSVSSLLVISATPSESGLLLSNLHVVLVAVSTVVALQVIVVKMIKAVDGFAPTYLPETVCRA